MPGKTRRSLFLLTGLTIFALLLASCASTGETGTPGAPTAGVASPPAGEVTEPVETTEATEATEPTEATEAPEATEGEPTAEATSGVPANGVSDVSPVGDPFPLGLELFAEGFVHPLVMQPAPGDDSGQVFVADQSGVVSIVSADGTVSETPFLDLRDRMVELTPEYDERGLLGMAFHPDYAENGRFYVYYSAPLAEGAPADWNHTSHISEFTVSDDPNVADPASERVLLTVDQPQMNHDGGQIAFGPDGYLYIPLGDGGAADDVAEGHVEDWYEANAGGNAQDLEQNLLGSILRIDVDGGDPFGIPADNPREDEQWAWGFRNPYRISFDLDGDGSLYVGDAGQNLFEEISRVGPEGGNFGWNVKEGTHCFSTDNPDEPPAEDCPGETPDGEPLIDPVIEFLNTATYDDGLGNTVIGGNVYRGSAIPELEGMYVFGVWSTNFQDPDGALFVSQPQEGEGLWEIRPVEANVTGSGERLGEFLLSFGVDAGNELYALTTESSGPQGETGKIYKIVAAE